MMRQTWMVSLLSAVTWAGCGVSPWLGLSQAQTDPSPQLAAAYTYFEDSCSEAQFARQISGYQQGLATGGSLGRSMSSSYLHGISNCLQSIILITEDGGLTCDESQVYFDEVRTADISIPPLSRQFAEICGE